MTSTQPSVFERAVEAEAIFHRSGLGVVFTRNRRITHCNAAFETMFGLGAGALVGAPTRVLFGSDEDYARFAQSVRSPLMRREAVEVDWTFGGLDLSRVPCRVRAQAINLSPENEETVWLFQDLSESLAQAEALRCAARDLEAVMQNAPISIIFTQNRAVTRANAEFCRNFGYTPATALELSGRDLFPDDETYAALGREAGPRLSRAESLIYETWMRRQNGEVFWAQLIAYVLNPQNTAEGTVWLISDRTEARRQAEEIERALFENQVILNSAVVGIVYVRQRIIERCNPLAEELFGFAPGTMPGHPTREWYLSEADYQAVADEVYPAVAQGKTYSHERRMRRQDGSAFWCRLSGHVLDRNDPLGGGSIWVVEDTTEAHLAEEALINTSAQLQAVFDSARVSIIVTEPDGIIRLMNQTAEQWLGYRAEELIGRETPACLHDPAEVVDYAAALSHRLGRPVQPGFDAFVAAALAFGSDEHEWSYLTRDGRRLPVQLTVSVLRDRHGGVTGYIGVAHDITDRRRADEAMRLAQHTLEEHVAQRTAELAEANRQLQREIREREAIEAKMRKMAHYDSLTGLPNRNLFMDRLNQALALARRHGTGVGLMFIDLDHFKQVNDTLGHDVGDLLLRHVADGMARVLRETDTLARIGGDEFVLLASDAGAPQELAVIAEKIVQAFAVPLSAQGQSIACTPSIGIACFPQDGADIATLMRHADQAMYQVKAAGRNGYRLYAEGDGEQGDQTPR